MRTRFGDFPEYHTSADNLDFVTSNALNDSFKMYVSCIEIFENNRSYETVVLCEPHLGRRGLYPSLSRKGSSTSSRLMKDIISYSDGSNDLLWIADKINLPVWELYPLVDKLVQNENSVLKLVA